MPVSMPGLALVLATLWTSGVEPAEETAGTPVSSAEQPESGGTGMRVSRLTVNRPGEAPRDASEADLEGLPPKVREALLKAIADGNTGPIKIEHDSEMAAEMAEIGKERNRQFRERWMGQPFPRDELVDREGHRRSLLGKPALVNFWATWCAPCLVEMPVFEAFVEAEPGWQVITVSNDFAESDLSDYLARRPLALPVVFDDKRELADTLGLSTYPTTFVLDADGRVSGILGHVEDLDDLRGKLAQATTPAGGH